MPLRGVKQTGVAGPEDTFMPKARKCAKQVNIPKGYISPDGYPLGEEMAAIQSGSVAMTSEQRRWLESIGVKLPQKSREQ
jgi:hypothetical protein